jgi:hypothetical protein
MVPAIIAVIWFGGFARWSPTAQRVVRIDRVNIRHSFAPGMSYNLRALESALGLNGSSGLRV